MQTKTNKMKHEIQGVTIESWYDEKDCNWQAYVKGTGTVSDVHNREDAIFSALELEKSTYCPFCGMKGKLSRLESDKGVHFGLACLPCEYAQSKKGSRDWYFIAGGLKERSFA
jgi:hypothetical protein